MTFPDGGWLRFAVAVLATWRITHLLANEDGPGDLIVRVRSRLGRGPLGAVMDCFHCLSIWVAAPMALMLGTTLPDRLLAWAALSGAACLLERLGRPAAAVPPIDGQAEGGHDGMLWSEASRTAGGGLSAPSSQPPRR
jgi:hypothetical protein